jgi:hypothetical protein
MDAKKLTDARDYLGTWLERSRQVVDAAPAVQRLYDVLDWEVRTYERRPTEAGSILTPDLDRYGELVYSRITSSLPMLPPIPASSITQVSSITASSTSAILAYVAEVSNLQTPSAVTYASSVLTEYGRLQESQQRPVEVRALLATRMPTVLPKFDSARDAYQRAQSGVGDRPTSALEMRTFLDGVKGELIERARGHTGENMTLELAVERLCSSAPTKLEIEEQIKQRSSLFATLSAVAKRRDESQAYELDGLWARVLDHAFVVVSGLK